METSIKKFIRDILSREVGSLSFVLSRQEIEGRGDYSSNVAFLAAKKTGEDPAKTAQKLAASLFEKYPDIFYGIEAVEPGFLNFFLSQGFIIKYLESSLLARRPKPRGKASVEFISANPTGPIHIGNARGGPIGDTISNILEEVGWRATREYFHNDAGAQIQKFADSLWYWYLKARRIPAELPEDGYSGEYVRRVGIDAGYKWKGKLLGELKGKEELLAFALESFWKANSLVIKKIGIKFDKITKESELAKKVTPKVLEVLKQKRLLKRKDSAWWFSPKGGPEAVVVKSDGTYLYFANDIAYHKQKFEKNDLVVDVLGEGHAGHIPKLKRIAEVFGFPRVSFKIIVHGQVSIQKRGKTVSMSKRKGQFVTAEEVLREVGPDAFRYFMLQYSPRSAMKFDLTLAKSRSQKNPVYYIQYAHARASGILRKAGGKVNFKKVDWHLLETLPEISLMKMILTLPEIIEETASDFEVQRLARYAYELARSFTNFYETTPVILTTRRHLDVSRPSGNLEVGPPSLEKSRLALVLVAQRALTKALSLMGISAPEKM